MSSKWRGHRTWRHAELGGFVAKAVDFSNEPAIIDNVIGRTKAMVGNAYPLDAAVAYTLAKAGPGKRLTVDEMVNDFTRGGFLATECLLDYMQGPHPETPAKGFCGHDMLNAFVPRLAGVKVIRDETGKKPASVAPASRNHWNQVSLLDSLLTIEQQMTGGNDVSVERAAEIKDMIPSLKFDKATNFNFDALIYDPAFAKVKDFIFKHHGTFTMDKQTAMTTFCNGWDTTKGECGFDNAQECLHHRNHKQSTGWYALVSRTTGELLPMFYRMIGNEGQETITNSYSVGGAHLAKGVLIPWDQIKRTALQNVDEKKLKSAIMKSVNRMVKRADCIVDKEGVRKSATFAWTDWGWLAEVKASLAYTNSKKRKIGDEVNGWKYGIYSSFKSHGHAIAKYCWKPIEPVNVYRPYLNTSSSRWSTSLFNTDRVWHLSEEAAQKWATKFADLLMEGQVVERHYTGADVSLPESWTWSIFKASANFTLKPDTNPEDFITPSEWLTVIASKPAEFFKPYRDLFYNNEWNVVGLGNTTYEEPEKEQPEEPVAAA